MPGRWSRKCDLYPGPRSTPRMSRSGERVLDRSCRGGSTPRSEPCSSASERASDRHPRPRPAFITRRTLAHELARRKVHSGRRRPQAAVEPRHLSLRVRRRAVSAARAARSPAGRRPRRARPSAAPARPEHIDSRANRRGGMRRSSCEGVGTRWPMRLASSARGREHRVNAVPSRFDSSLLLTQRKTERASWVGARYRPRRSAPASRDRARGRERANPSHAAEPMPPQVSRGIRTMRSR